MAGPHTIRVARRRGGRGGDTAPQVVLPGLLGGVALLAVGFVVAVGVVAAALVLAGWIGPSALVALGALATGCLLATTEGSVDSAAMTLDYGGRTIGQAALRRARSVSLGPATVFRLSFVHGGEPLDESDGGRSDGGRARVRPVFERAVAAEPPDVDPAGRAERVVVALFALGCLAVGPGLWTLIPAESGGRGIAVYLGLFGLLVGWLLFRHVRTA